MAQQASISLKTVCKADELLLCLGPEFGNTGNMSTCGVLFGGDKCKTLRLVGKLSASLSKDLDAAKADNSSQVKVSHSLRVHKQPNTYTIQCKKPSRTHRSISGMTPVPQASHEPATSSKQ